MKSQSPSPRKPTQTLAKQEQFLCGENIPSIKAAFSLGADTPKNQSRRGEQRTLRTTKPRNRWSSCWRLQQIFIPIEQYFSPWGWRRAGKCGIQQRKNHPKAPPAQHKGECGDTISEFQKCELYSSKYLDRAKTPSVWPEFKPPSNLKPKSWI